MNISSETYSYLALLNHWGSGNQVYSLYDFRDMELHGSFGKCELVEEWFADDFNEKGYDFIEFGYSRAGDPFALWIYPELKGEPPVVLLDSDGEVELLAPSMADQLLTHQLMLKNGNVPMTLLRNQVEQASKK